MGDEVGICLEAENLMCVGAVGDGELEAWKGRLN